MKIVILNGSPRKGGNTAALVKAFTEGAESKGHSVIQFPVGTMNIRGCIACEACRKSGSGKCVQQDEMQQVYPDAADADMIVLASPVYFWSFTGQMQSAISRLYCLGKLNADKYAMILSSGSPNVYDAVNAQFDMLLKWFSGKDAGRYMFNGGEQQSEENLNQLRAFGASL